MNDITGRKQFAKNVVVTWTAHIFILIAGFVLPRQISDNLGSDSLGIWDLGWATVRYLSLTNMGFGSSLTRYSAMYLAKNDFIGLSKAYTAVAAWQLVLTTLVIITSAVFSWSLSYWMEFSDSARLNEAQLIIFLLGVSLAARMLGAPAGGLIAGCHRWDIQNSLNAAIDFLLAAILISSMLFGAGLVSMAWIVVAVTLVGTVIRHLIANKLVPDVKLHFKHLHFSTAFKMLRFGVKSQLGGAPSLIIFQTVSILLVGHAGPTALAIFNRATALIRHCEVIIKKMTMMFTPMVSSLIGLGDIEKARTNLIQASRYSLCFTLPILLVIFWYGDLVIHLWMGLEYANQTLVQILAAGSVLPISQTATISVLAGLNAHGKVTLLNLALTVSTLVMAILFVSQLGWSEVSAALITGTVWSIGTIVSILYYLRRLVHISPISYLSKSILIPVISNLPLFFLLWYSRLHLVNNSWWTAAALIISGGAVTLTIYWLFILSKEDRLILRKKLLQK